MSEEKLKQRLIELIASKVCKKYNQDNCPSKWSGCCGECENDRNFQIGDIADHLIANGGIIRERGEWKLYGNDDDLGSSFFCSLCGGDIDEDIFYRSQTNDYKMYKCCPHCGADMRGVKDE